MKYLDFLQEQFGGKNWVVARRSKRILARYGEDVVCVSPQQYRNAELAYRIQYGDPYPARRDWMHAWEASR